MFRTLLDILFLSRPVLLVPVWGFALAGYRSAAVSPAGWGFSLTRGTSASVYGAVLLFSAAVGAVYVCNQLADRDIDEQNDGFALLAQGGVGRGTGRLAFAIWTLIPLLVLTVLFPGPLLLFSVGALALGGVYSIPPISLSGRPIADFLANGIGYGIIAFGVGWYLGGGSPQPAAFFAAALPCFLLMCGGSISSTLPDLPGDRQGGKRTTAVVLGERRAHLLATFFIASAAGAAVAVGDYPVVVASICSLVLYIRHAVAPSPASREATYKVGGALYMFLLALLFPPFGLLGGLTFAATRLYFRFRFRVHYPSLLPMSHDR